MGQHAGAAFSVVAGWHAVSGADGEGARAAVVGRAAGRVVTDPGFRRGNTPLWVVAGRPVCGVYAPGPGCFGGGRGRAVCGGFRFNVGRWFERRGAVGNGSGKRRAAEFDLGWGVVLLG